MFVNDTESQIRGLPLAPRMVGKSFRGARRPPPNGRITLECERVWQLVQFRNDLPHAKGIRDKSYLPDQEMAAVHGKQSCGWATAPTKRQAKDSFRGGVTSTISPVRASNSDVGCWRARTSYTSRFINGRSVISFTSTLDREIP